MCVVHTVKWLMFYLTLPLKPLSLMAQFAHIHDSARHAEYITLLLQIHLRGGGKNYQPWMPDTLGTSLLRKLFYLPKDLYFCPSITEICSFATQHSFICFFFAVVFYFIFLSKRCLLNIFKQFPMYRHCMHSICMKKYNVQFSHCSYISSCHLTLLIFCS